jgi:hypothetical protein
MIGQDDRDDHAATFFPQELRDDRLSHLACARRPPRDRHLGMPRVSRSKTLTESSHTRTAINVKVVEPMQSGDDPLKMIHRIERVIVHPEDSLEKSFAHDLEAFRRQWL